MGRFEPPPEAFNNFLISVGKEDPDVGLTLVQKFIFKISALWGRIPMGKCFKVLFTVVPNLRGGLNHPLRH